MVRKCNFYIEIILHLVTLRLRKKSCVSRLDLMATSLTSMISMAPFSDSTLVSTWSRRELAARRVSFCTVSTISAISVVEFRNFVIPRWVMMVPRRLTVMAKPVMVAISARQSLQPVIRFGLDVFPESTCCWWKVFFCWSEPLRPEPSQQRQRKKMRKKSSVRMSQNPGSATRTPSDSRYSLSVGSKVTLAGSGRKRVSTWGIM